MRHNLLGRIARAVAFAAIGLAWFGEPAVTFGQSVPALRGNIASFKGQDLILASPDGEVKIGITNKTIIRQEVPIKFSEITPGMYVGATATKQADGLFMASAVHVFSEDQRGVGEGHRPLSSAPKSGKTMTNASVERVEESAVRDVKGRVLNLKYKDGELRVLVPPDIPVVKRIVADRGALKPGAEVSVQAARGADGSLSASQITVRAAAR